MTKEEKLEIASIIRQKIALIKCPMCGKSAFTIGEGYVFNEVHSDYRHRVIGGAGIPSVLLICSNCGFISQHAIGALGLLKDSNQEQESKRE